MPDMVLMVLIRLNFSHLRTVVVQVSYSGIPSINNGISVRLGYAKHVGMTILHKWSGGKY